MGKSHGYHNRTQRMWVYNFTIRKYICTSHLNLTKSQKEIRILALHPNANLIGNTRPRLPSGSLISVISTMTSLCMSVLLCHASTWIRSRNYPWFSWERERRKHYLSAGPVNFSWACLSWTLVKCWLAASYWVWNHTNSLTWSILVIIWSQANARMKKLETWSTLYHKDCNCCLSFYKMSSLPKYSNHRVDGESSSHKNQKTEMRSGYLCSMVP